LEKSLLIILFISVVSFIVILNLKEKNKDKDTKPRLIKKALKEKRKRNE